MLSDQSVTEILYNVIVNLYTMFEILIMKYSFIVQVKERMFGHQMVCRMTKLDHLLGKVMK